MKEKYVLDSSVLMDDHKSIEILRNGVENEIYIPKTVIDEIDGLKKNDGKRQQVLRILGELEKYKDVINILGTKEYGNKPDNKILEEILGLENKEEYTFVSNDNLLRLKAYKAGIKTEEFRSSNPFLVDSEKYTGIVPLYNENGKQDFSKYPNSFHFSDTGKLMYYSGAEKKIQEVPENLEIWKVTAWDVYQRALMHLLLDDNVLVASVMGNAGCGKTLIALAAALQLVIQEKKHRKIYITTSNIEATNDLGFRPGPQPLDAKILTPTGWTTMGDVKIGDYVIGRNGKPSKVLETFENGVQPVYRVYTTNGESTKACGNHVWATKNHNELKHKKDFVLRSTNEIAETLFNNNKPNHTLPTNCIVEFNSKEELFIPPYTMGVILGDGWISNSVGFCSIDEEIVNNVKQELGPLGFEVNNIKNTIHYNISQKSKPNRPKHPLKITNLITDGIVIYDSINDAALELGIHKSTLYSRAMKGVYGDDVYEILECEKFSNDIKNYLSVIGLENCVALTKHIPNEYKYTSVENRLELLRGLMDTDGTIKNNGKNCITFTTVSETLKNDVIEICRSLGIYCTFSSRMRKTPSYIDGREIISKNRCYEVYISSNTNFNIFKLSRKADRFKKTDRLTNIKINKVEYCGEEEVKCIKIDNEDSLYITDGFIVTHNTVEEKFEPLIKHAMILLQELNELRPAHKLFNDEGTGFNSKVIEFIPMNFLRGMTLKNCVVIGEEMQNISKYELRTITSRCGTNVKLIATGDLNQIDNQYLNKENNGLNWLVKSFQGDKRYGHIKMSGKRARGPICEMTNDSFLL